MNWLVGLIIFCEVAFWIFVVGGLFSRYILRKQRLSIVLLAMSPAVDFILLIATSYDLYRGGIAGYPHALAAVYIGISVGFGKNMIRWADEKFQRMVLKKSIEKKSLYGLAFAKEYAKGWFRHILAFAVGGGIIGGILLWIGDLSRTKAMIHVLGVWTIVFIIDSIITLSYFLIPKRPDVNG